MIVCYHKARKKYYVIKDNTKAGRKFLFYSSSLKECQDFAGPAYVMSRSAREAIDPTRPTPPSDAETRHKLVHDPIIAAAARDASDDLALIARLAKVIHGSIGKPEEPWENYLNDARLVAYDVKALERKRA